VAKIRAHKSEASNLLKLSYKINDCVLSLGFRSDKFVHDFACSKMI
jgi:hypothetical protein